MYIVIGCWALFYRQLSTLKSFLWIFCHSASTLIFSFILKRVIVRYNGIRGRSSSPSRVTTEAVVVAETWTTSQRSCRPWAFRKNRFDLLVITPGDDDRLSQKSSYYFPSCRAAFLKLSEGTKSDTLQSGFSSGRT